jgi:hypothetical protein
VARGSAVAKTAHLPALGRTLEGAASMVDSVAVRLSDPAAAGALIDYGTPAQLSPLLGVMVH